MMYGSTSRQIAAGTAAATNHPIHVISYFQVLAASPTIMAFGATPVRNRVDVITVV